MTQQICKTCKGNDYITVKVSFEGETAEYTRNCPECVKVPEENILDESMFSKIFSQPTA
jgi:hypothetical protein